MASAPQLEQIREYLRTDRLAAAKALAQQFTALYPRSADGWIQLSRALSRLSNFGDALAAGEKALALDPNHPMAPLVFIEAALGCGQIGRALEAARALEHDKRNDPAVILQVGYVYTRTNRHLDAVRCYERVRVLQPTNLGVIHNLAGACQAVGEFDRSEWLYNELIQKEPRAYEAYYNRATVRKQTPERNNIAELKRVLAGLNRGSSAEQPICYALAKELEDLGEWSHAFQFLKRGADSHRRNSSYSVDADISMMDGIRRNFGSAFFERRGPGYDGEGPIFILGMPRTGTTLVDRILSAHSLVGSVGESEEFFRALMRRAYGGDGKWDILRVRDWTNMGGEFCRALAAILPGPKHRLDKTPNNFLYLGLILTALPNAKIIHVRRNPVDTCYAIYKTLFRQSYEYSYDLNDLGRYYLAYHALMEHWTRVLPGGFLTVDYEDLVSNQEQVSRRMVAFCGLDWEDACLSFEKNTSPSLTASAAQVRRSVYTTSVGLWRHFEAELEPLARILRQGGIECV